MKLFKMLLMSLTIFNTTFAMAQNETMCSLANHVHSNLTLVNAIEGTNGNNPIHLALGVQRYKTTQATINLNDWPLYFKANQGSTNFKSDKIVCVAETAKDRRDRILTGEHTINTIVIGKTFDMFMNVEGKHVQLKCSPNQKLAESEINFENVNEIPLEIRKLIKVPCKNLSPQIIGSSPDAFNPSSEQVTF